MKTIHKKKIKYIVAHLVEGCEVEVVSTEIAMDVYIQPQLISFGTGVTGNEIRFNHYLSDDGKKLTINTFHDENNEIVSPCSYKFKIILPIGVHLKFTYAPQPLGFGSRH